MINKIREQSVVSTCVTSGRLRVCVETFPSRLESLSSLPVLTVIFMVWVVLRARVWFSVRPANYDWYHPASPLAQSCVMCPINCPHYITSHYLPHITTNTTRLALLIDTEETRQGRAENYYLSPSPPSHGSIFSPEQAHCFITNRIALILAVVSLNLSLSRMFSIQRLLDILISDINITGILI